ncbi:amidohydrolase family protein [Roseiconus nitratireducens]|uniref:amidohydrolase family protein n=1 Tax=Roseiconus nitratireducens TaxID=2605748 RepID=UPI0013761544|nr:amidohydrolase family protein [Roseiconus nitratireducens]
MTVCSAILFDAQAAEPETKPWIIDPHTHFKGPEQIALEAKTTKYHPKNTLGHVVTPKDYRPVADRLGIQATVVVEAVDQEHPQFNDWVLEQAKSNLICGYIARGDLASTDFVVNYRRYQASGYLRGYRFRREELQGYLKNGVARANLKLLEQDGMVVDLLVDSGEASSVIALAQDYPQLTIVIDHCFRARLKDGMVTPEWTTAVADCGKYPNVHCKLSSLLNFCEGAPFAEPAPTDLDTYSTVLQTCFNAFGEDRVMFASNWAVCTHYGKVDDVVRIVSQFLKSQGEQALRKGMRDNAIRVFKIREEHLR